MIDAITQPFIEFSFMRRALVGCFALSLGAPPIGVFLMLRRMSLMGDAMSHAILPGAAIGYLLAGLSLLAMSLGGFAAGLAVALAAGLVARSTVLREDASLAAFYLVSLALGVMIVSVRGSNVDLLHVLFGTVLALDDHALLLVASIATLSLAVLAVIYRPLVLECFDPQFLRSVSARPLSFPSHGVLRRDHIHFVFPRPRLKLHETKRHRRVLRGGFRVHRQKIHAKYLRMEVVHRYPDLQIMTMAAAFVEGRDMSQDRGKKQRVIVHRRITSRRLR